MSLYIIFIFRSVWLLGIKCENLEIATLLLYPSLSLLWSSALRFTKKQKLYEAVGFLCMQLWIRLEEQFSCQDVCHCFGLSPSLKASMHIYMFRKDNRNTLSLKLPVIGQKLWSQVDFSKVWIQSIEEVQSNIFFDRTLDLYLQFSWLKNRIHTPALNVDFYILLMG